MGEIGNQKMIIIVIMLMVMMMTMMTIITMTMMIIKLSMYTTRISDIFIFPMFNSELITIIIKDTLAPYLAALVLFIIFFALLLLLYCCSFPILVAHVRILHLHQASQL